LNITACDLEHLHVAVHRKLQRWTPEVGIGADILQKDVDPLLMMLVHHRMVNCSLRGRIAVPVCQRRLTPHRVCPRIREGGCAQAARAEPGHFEEASASDMFVHVPCSYRYLISGTTDSNSPKITGSRFGDERTSVTTFL
jgi:hypothetical protein